MSGFKRTNLHDEQIHQKSFTKIVAQKPRDITRVIAFLCLEVIPVTEVCAIQALRDIAQRSMYTPPENQRSMWVLATNALMEHVGLPDGTPWKIRLRNVFNDEEKIPKDWRP